MGINRFLAISGALLLAGCATVAPDPTPLMAGGDLEVLDRLREGRRLYIDKCSGCHALKSVVDYSDQQWEGEVAKMIRLKKVRLEREDREKLLQYLTTLNGESK